jgi:hypothetical protein
MATIQYRHARRRAFTPHLEGFRPLERRAVPGPLWGDLWHWPQSYIDLTDDTGHHYPVHSGQDLIRGLQQIADGGHSVGSLFIKGHGGGDLIMLTDTDPHDTLAVVGGNVLIDGQPANDLLRRSTGPRSTIYLTGCGTGDLARSLSGMLPGTVVVGNTLPGAIGIPGTSMSIGRYIQYRNGAPL